MEGTISLHPAVLLVSCGEKENSPPLSEDEIESQADNSEEEASSCQYHKHYSQWKSNSHHFLYGDAVIRNTI